MSVRGIIICFASIFPISKYHPFFVPVCLLCFEQSHAPLIIRQVLFFDPNLLSNPLEILTSPFAGSKTIYQIA